jgi:dTDP-4-amino-4,6-dideoxygalactose transaminase
VSSIPLVDLRAQWQAIRAEAEPAMAEVLASGGFILGPTVERFERAFASWVGAEHAVGVGNGTDAVEIALRACGIGKGDEVLVPVNTFVASAIGVLRAGATPVYVDCDEATYLIDLNAAARAVTSRTRALLAVHLYGRLCDPAALVSFCDAQRLVLVEDAAQAHGARSSSGRAGSIGRAAAFSFYPGKNLGAAGDGGALTTSDPEVAARAAAFRNYGSPRKYEHPEFGVNSRLDALQAALLDVKLRYIDAWNESRRRIARAYRERLEGVSGVRAPELADGEEHVMHVFVARVGGERRDRVLARLGEAGIGAGIHYPVPVAFLKGVDADARRGDFPVAEMLAGEILSLPLYPEMTDGQVDRVCEVLKVALE